MTEIVEPESRKLIPFDPNRPRMLALRRTWFYKSEIRDGDILDMKGRVIKMGGISVMVGSQGTSEPSGPKFNFNRFGPQIPDPEG